MPEKNNSWVAGIVLFGLIILVGYILFAESSSSATGDTGSPVFERTQYNAQQLQHEESNIDSDDGYGWAENNDPTTFSECQDQFGTSDEEDACNEYVKENYSGEKTYNGYECTEDCSGHEAGYNWAEENNISDESDCDGNSNSFNEGCSSFVEENY